MDIAHIDERALSKIEIAAWHIRYWGLGDNFLWAANALALAFFLSVEIRVPDQNWTIITVFTVFHTLLIWCVLMALGMLVKKHYQLEEGKQNPFRNNVGGRIFSGALFGAMALAFHKPEELASYPKTFAVSAVLMVITLYLFSCNFMPTTWKPRSKKASVFG